MTHIPATLLVVDGDPAAARTLAAQAEARGYEARTASSLAAALALMREEAVDLLLVDLGPGAECATELLSQLSPLPADVEVLLLAREASIAAAMQWFDSRAFGLVPKGDVVQVFAGVARSLDRRRITRQNRRLVWELRTVNDIAAGIARSLELDDVLTGALQVLVRALEVTGGSIRLRNDTTGGFDVGAAVGPPALGLFWRQPPFARLRPSDHVIATRASIIVEDLAADAATGEGVTSLPEPLPVRSAISVPLLAGSELVGTLSLGAVAPRRFQIADQRLLAGIACQLVVAIQNVRLHQTIRAGKREWEATFDAISDPIAVFDERGELLRGNQALADHLSLPITALRHLTRERIGFDSAERQEAGAAAALPRGRARDEVTLPDGRIFSVAVFPVSTSAQGASVVQVAKNVTEEIRGARRLQQMTSELAAINDRLVAAMNTVKATQEQLVRAEKLTAMGHLVAGVAHELNNPLTSVIGYAQLVEDELRAGESARPLLEIAADVRRIAEESERAAAIVRDMLAFARRQSTARAPQDLGALCERTLALRKYECRQRRIELILRIAPDLPPVHADAGQLQQVLLNLVLNAEQAMRTSAVRRLVVATRADPTCGAVELSVSDTGHGVERAHLTRLFDPFFTTRQVGEGTGLGLSICYGIVRAHGGVITVESTPGSGATFRVLLPARRSGTEAGKDVLVAHGDQSEREFVAAVLAGWGYRVRTAASLEEIERNTATSLHLAVVERDVLCADPQAARRLGPGVRTIVMAPTEEPEMGRTGPQHAAAILGPPVDLRSLFGAVAACEHTEECV